jgi:hypothetical protein
MRPIAAPLVLLLAPLATTLWSGGIHGQQVMGRVVDQATGQHVEGAAVALSDREGVTRVRAVTGRDGRFVLAAGASGSYVLSVSRFGYQPMESDPILIDPDERLVVEVRLGVDAIPLEPLVVTGRRNISPAIAAFYERLEAGRRSGQGHFISRAEIEEFRPSRTTDLLRSVSGMRVDRSRGGRGDVVRMRGGCIPAVYIDGTHINRMDARHSVDEYVVPSAIEGIEVYRGAGRSVGHYYDPRGCGVVLVWTQRGELVDGAPMRWRTVGIVVGALLGLILLVN